MKKPAWQTDKWLKPFRKAQAAKGPVGLDLLAEVLNWDPDRVDLSNFGVLDSRHRVLHKLTVEAKYAQAKTEWRDILRSVQSEVRKDLLSLLEPAQLSEEEFRYWDPTYWDPDTGRRVFPPVHKTKTPRQNRLLILTTKLNAFHWTFNMDATTTTQMLQTFMAGRPSTTIGGWSDEEGEYSNQIGMFEIDGERLIVQERGPSLRGLRETLFFIIYKALLNGKFGKLRRCKKCGKFCVPPKGGDHCSEFCRRASSNKERANANYFANKYVTNKKSRLDGAKARFLASVKSKRGKTFDSINEAISKSMERVLTGKVPLTGSKKEFRKFVEEYRAKALERFD